MAGNMAWKAGKGALHKFGGKNSHHDPTVMSVDHSHYRGAKVIETKDGRVELSSAPKDIANNHRKDTAYYMYMGIPKKDAKILSGVVQRARYLDNGMSLMGYKIGVNTIIEAIPGAGDFVGTGLSFLLVYCPAYRVSKGPGSDRKKLRRNLTVYLVTGGTIGLVPMLGDIADTMLKFNVKSADALEKMLLNRVKDAAKMGLDAEQAGTTTAYRHAVTNGDRVVATNGHHGSAFPTHPPRRFIGTKDLRQDSRPSATAQAPAVQTQPKKSGGSFFQRRGGQQGSQEVGTTIEEVAPGRPPRPNNSHYERGGHF